MLVCPDVLPSVVSLACFVKNASAAAIAVASPIFATTFEDKDARRSEIRDTGSNRILDLDLDENVQEERIDKLMGS